MNGGEIIRVREVSKQFPGNTYKSVDGLSLSIGTASKFGIFGPNGAGKTTLISMMCGLLVPDSGEIWYNGEGRKSPHEMRGRLGYVPQDFAFYPELSLNENLRYFGALYRLSSGETAKRSQELLHILGLTEFAKKPVSQFSGGMKRRVNLAIGLIHRPAILFLDEPTVGVDVQSRIAIMEFLEQLNASGTTIVYTSHHLGEAEAFCDYSVLMDQGKIVTEGETRKLLESTGKESLEDLFLQLTGKSYRDA